MNLLEAKSGGEELIENFADQLIFVNALLKNMSAEEQLESVEHYLTLEGASELKDMISASFVTGDLEGDEEDFYDNTRLLLLELQQPLGQKPLELRGAGSDNMV